VIIMIVVICVRAVTANTTEDLPTTATAGGPMYFCKTTWFTHFSEVSNHRHPRHVVESFSEVVKLHSKLASVETEWGGLV
jgi:hypothetical protein